MKMTFKRVVFGTAAAALMTGASLASAQSVTGAGSSFAAPVYGKWAAAYNKETGVKVNYQSVGSGAGMRQIDAKTVDFGASDMPQTDEVLAKKGELQFPSIMGGIVAVVNVKGIKPGELKLSGPVLADIYLGKITKWNDAAITSLNPGVSLPDATISPVRRADGSGTTFGFTNYLSKVSSEWKEKVGEGTAVNWPVGAGGKGNEGVSAFVGRLPNSIGYVEYAYAKQNNMTFTQLQNHDGHFVSPSNETFGAAAAGADWNKSFYQILTNQPGKSAWPIASATFVLIHKVADKPEQTREVMKFFDWSFKHGKQMAVDLVYVPMPDSVVHAIESKIFSQVKDSSGKTVSYK